MPVQIHQTRRRHGSSSERQRQRGGTISQCSPSLPGHHHFITHYTSTITNLHRAHCLQPEVHKIIWLAQAQSEHMMPIATGMGQHTTAPKGFVSRKNRSQNL
jgi:hypothetical protein